MSLTVFKASPLGKKKIQLWIVGLIREFLTIGH